MMHRYIDSTITGGDLSPSEGLVIMVVFTTDEDLSKKFQKFTALYRFNTCNNGFMKLDYMNPLHKFKIITVPYRQKSRQHVAKINRLSC